MSSPRGAARRDHAMADPGPVTLAPVRGGQVRKARSAAGRAAPNPGSPKPKSRKSPAVKRAAKKKNATAAAAAAAARGVRPAMSTETVTVLPRPKYPSSLFGRGFPSPRLSCAHRDVTRVPGDNARSFTTPFAVLIGALVAFIRFSQRTAAEFEEEGPDGLRHAGLEQRKRQAWAVQQRRPHAAGALLGCMRCRFVVVGCACT